ncbi:hypothetical protein JTB14_018728 [Gonioctena quinquepunctata]|nr:hypothetical protein JTB14_018728 [Gonioctena quinquepunctata]
MYTSFNVLIVLSLPNYFLTSFQVKKIFENNILKNINLPLPKDRGNQKISPYGENGDSGNDSCEGFGPTNCNTSRAVPCSNSISELTCEIEKMKIIQREQEQQIKELTKLNIELQRDVININRALVEKIEKMVGGGSLKKDNVEIGTVVDDEVHLGQNVFIKKGSYDTAYVTARSGTQFVKNIAMAVFGALTLKNSSVTGKSSNNIKRKYVDRIIATKLSAIHVKKTNPTLDIIGNEEVSDDQVGASSAIG